MMVVVVLMVSAGDVEMVVVGEESYQYDIRQSNKKSDPNVSVV